MTDMSFVNIDGGRLYYDLTDITPPWIIQPDVVILHHGAAEDSRAWSAWLPLLGGECRVLRSDVRGCGRSSAPQPGFDWTLDQLVADVLDVAHAAGVVRFHFVGSGIGGNVGLHMASRYADRLLSVTAINCAAEGGAVRGMSLWSGMLESDGRTAWAKAVMADRFYAGELPPEQARWFERELSRQPHGTSVNLASMQLEMRMSAGLSALQVPVLLLCADDSPYVGVSNMADMQARIPGASLAVMTRARDGLAVSHAVQCVDVVRPFLKRCGSRRSLDMPAVI